MPGVHRKVAVALVRSRRPGIGNWRSDGRQAGTVRASEVPVKTRVLQLNRPACFMYSLVYQKVQSSGSTTIEL